MRTSGSARFIPCAGCGHRRWCRRSDDLCRQCQKEAPEPEARRVLA